MAHSSTFNLMNILFINPFYHLVIPPFVSDYKRGLSFRQLSKKYNLCYKTARDLLIGENIEIRQNDGSIYATRRGDKEIESAISDYKNGAGIRTIQEKYKINSTVFHKYLEKSGVPVRSRQEKRFPHLNKKNREKVAKDFNNGLSMKEIAVKNNISFSSVKTLLRHAGIRRRSRSEIIKISKFKTKGTENIPGYFISQWKGSTKTRGWDWELTPKDLQDIYEKQGGKCFYTGLKLEIPQKRKSGRKRSPYRMSLDRIDSLKGYIPENVVLSSAFANYAKNNFSIEEFEFLLDETSKYRLSKKN